MLGISTEAFDLNNELIGYSIQNSENRIPNTLNHHEVSNTNIIFEHKM